jgi:hypothetical protein
VESGTVAVTSKKTKAVIAHPVRVQILMVAIDRPISPSRFVVEVLEFDQDTEPVDYKRALSLSSYHFRELEKAGCLEIVDHIPKRGAIEHVYRAVERAAFIGKEWAEVPPDERGGILGEVWQQLVVRVEAARLGHTLDRDETWLAWTDAKLDDRGWAEMRTTVAANFAELERIREESEARIGEGAGGEPVPYTPATFAMLGFEKPSRAFYRRIPEKKDSDWTGSPSHSSDD